MTWSPVPARTPGIALVVAATACWGVGTVLSKQALDRGTGPLALLAIELAASSLLLGLLRLGGAGSGPRPSRRLIALGLLNPGLAYALGLWGLMSVSASLAVLAWATEPILIALLATFWLRERMPLPAALATAAAVGGALLVVARPGASGDAAGIALTIAAVTACAFYTVLTRSLLLDDSSLAVALAQQSVALVAAAAVAGVAVGTDRGLGLPDDAVTWGYALASGVVYYGLAFCFYIAGLRRVPATLAGSMLPLIPVSGLAAAHLAGERLAGHQWWGVVLVVGGTLAAALLHERDREDEAAGLGTRPADRP